MANDDRSKSTELPLPTGVDLTPFAPAYREDPYAVLGSLQAREPVHHDETFHQWLLLRHEDVDAVLKDNSLVVDPHKAAPGTFSQIFLAPRLEPQQSLLFSDPPVHTRLRALVNKAFTPRAVEQMAPRIQQIAYDLLDQVAALPEFDLMPAFAAPLPTIVIAEMLGVDPEHRAEFKRWSDDLVMTFDPMITTEMKAQLETTRAEIFQYLQSAIADRRARPRDDLMSALIAAEDDRHQLTTHEIIVMCVLLLSAGNVTTTDLIGNGTLALLKHPAELQKLQQDPSLIKRAVEEMLRFDSPVMATGRIPLQDVTIGGCPIHAGQSLTPMLSAANHDPAVYPDPHRFDITRADAHHHSFGGGAHFCLGAPLARLEAQIAIGTLVRRFPRLRLGEGTIQRRMLPGFRGLRSLPVLVS